MYCYKNAKSIIDSKNDLIIIKLRNFIIETDLNKTDILSDSELTTRFEKKLSKLLSI